MSERIDRNLQLAISFGGLRFFSQRAKVFFATSPDNHLQLHESS